MVTLVLLRAKTYHKAGYRSLTSWPSDPDAISLRSSGMRRKQNFEIIFGFKSDTAVLTFTFLSLLPSFFTFLSSFFFSCWVFSRLHFVGKVFRKAFRILGLDERKGRWVVEQDFHGNFQVNVTWFFAFFCGVLH